MAHLTEWMLGLTRRFSDSDVRFSIQDSFVIVGKGQEPRRIKTARKFTYSLYQHLPRCGDSIEIHTTRASSSSNLYHS